MALTAKCPVCGVDMKKVSARADPGRLIVLDQCGRCGGIWCDKWELYPVAPDEAQRIDPLDDRLLRDLQPLPDKTLYCPRCADRLQLFHDPLLPADIQFQRCRHCEGIWLNRGNFARFKNFQQKTRDEKMPEEERLKRLTQAVAQPQSWVEVGTQGIFEYPRAITEVDEQRTNVNNGVFWLIVQTLLRLVLGI
jgi:Zn-finger nucleic acid-binding protein